MMDWPVLICLLAPTLLAQRVKLVNRRSLLQQMLIHEMFIGYDRNVRPRGTNESNPDHGGPVLVHLQLDIQFLNRISDIDMVQNVV